MKIFVIPPLEHLELAHMGDKCYYALAHLYYQHEHYRQFFKAAVKRGDFVTLDNSAAEKSLVTEDILIEIVKDLKPNEVIAPDILFDKDKTLAALKAFSKRLYLEGIKVDIFAVPQGKTQEEWLDCYQKMLWNPEVAVIGLSKISVPYCWYDKAKKDTHIKEARNKCIKYLQRCNLIKKPIHCLGQGDFKEFGAYKNIPLIRSTDSCYPVLAAIKGIEYDKNFERVETYNGYFDTKMTEEQTKRALWNILCLKRYTK